MSLPYSMNGTLALWAGLIPMLATTAWASDRTPPKAPTNLRVTGVTSYTVSLAWNASTDNSGNFSYRVRSSQGLEASVPKTQTSFTWTTKLEAGRSYSFFVYAVDAAGNKSKNSNTVSVTLPADRTPPTQPVVSVTDVGATHVTLSWSSVDDGPNVWFWVFQDGVAVLQGTRDTSATILLLEPETTYTFTVQARDFGMNWSAVSEPTTVTTEAVNTNDTTPPTAPGNLRTNGMEFQDGEVWLFWDASSDDVDPALLLRYDVYVNGVLDHSVAGQTQTILYVPVGILNTLEVVAVDPAGNPSEPATIVVDMR